MKMGQHELHAICPKCDGSMKVRGVRYSADGKMEFDFLCPEDGMKLTQSWFSPQLCAAAFRWDIEADFRERERESAPREPAQPAESSTETGISAFDVSFMEEIGLRDDFSEPDSRGNG